MPPKDREPDRPAAVDEVSSGASRLFDLRYLIGTLFTFYGVVLTIASFFISHTRSGNIDINLWLGLGMLALGVFFLLWARWRPLHTEGESLAARQDE